MKALPSRARRQRELPQTVIPLPSGMLTRMDHQAHTEDQIQAVRLGGARPLPGGRMLLVEYDPTWPGLFVREAARVRDVLGDRVHLLEHVGSTSVPDCWPSRSSTCCSRFRTQLTSRPTYRSCSGPGTSCASVNLTGISTASFKGPDADINLHVFSDGCPEIDRMLLFRDWLRSNPEDCEQYARAKRDLAQRTWTYTQNCADAQDTRCRADHWPGTAAGAG